MPLLRSRSDAPTAEVTLEPASYDVLHLARLWQHPLVQPLVDRKTALRTRVDTLEQEHITLSRALADFERSQAIRLAEGEVEGTQAWRDLKQHITENEDSQRITQQAIELLEPEVEAALSAARLAVQTDLDRLFVAPVRAMIQSL